MLDMHRYVRKTLSAQLTLCVVSSVAVLLLTALGVMFYYSHQVLKEETMAKATHTLDTTVEHIDNTLHRVEVAANHMLWNVEQHLYSPETMHQLARQMLVSNPILQSCAISMEPNFFPRKGRLFMSFAYRKDSAIVLSDHITDQPYTIQDWYVMTKKQDGPCWMKPRELMRQWGIAICFYNVPIRDKSGRLVGVLSAGLSLDRLSNAVISAKPFPHSYASVLGRHGSYIIHPDTTKLFKKSIYDLLKDQPDNDMQQLVLAVMQGETGCRDVMMDGQLCYVFYKPFKNERWRAAIVCPKSDVFGADNKLRNNMLQVALFSLLALICFCLLVVHYHLNPLQLLSRWAERAVDNQFSQSVPDTKRKDEIGVLQTHFQEMQQSVTHRLTQIQEQSNVLQKRGEQLQEDYLRELTEERTKTAAVQNVTDSMLSPVDAMKSIVAKVRVSRDYISQQELSQSSQQLQKQSRQLTQLIDQLLQQVPEKQHEEGGQ
jgi:HAMP domain-containing protein